MSTICENEFGSLFSLHIQILKFQIIIFRISIILFISSTSYTYLRTVLTKHLGINLGFEVWRLGSGQESVVTSFLMRFTWRYMGSQKRYNLLWWKVNIAIACTGISSNSPEHLYDLTYFFSFPFLYHCISIYYRFAFRIDYIASNGHLQLVIPSLRFFQKQKKQRPIFVQLITVARQIVITLSNTIAKQPVKSLYSPLLMQSVMFTKLHTFSNQRIKTM
jgi:hypothetical protein